MTSDKNNVQDSVGSRTRVAKNPNYAKLKDKLLFIGVIVICIGIGANGLIPKRKTSPIVDENNKENTALQLNQNLALIAALRNQSKTLSSNYQGGTTMNPPVLTTKPQTDTLTKETLARMNAPSTFFSVSGNGSESKSKSKLVSPRQDKALMGHDANSAFLNQQDDITSVSAKRLPHPSLTVPAGEMIPATLETAIQSELAGMVRAVTMRDSYALSGDKLLIPKGSTLVGQFNTAITQAQRRVFVVWNRLQLTNGVMVTLNSPSSDAIGRSGQAADVVDRHFFERFGHGALLSVLGGYTATVGVKAQDEYNASSQYRMNVAGQFQQAANQTLQQDMQTRPTLQVNQGATINVFVAHDLDFYRVAGNR